MAALVYQNKKQDGPCEAVAQRLGGGVLPDNRRGRPGARILDDMRSDGAAALQRKFDVADGARRAAVAPAPNRTGLPDGLKAGVETLSGMTMDHVKVHYNSPRPAQLNALAYAQGSDIHVAPGQERHLPHEAWHVVQQAQGRVKPTMQMRGGVGVNDDDGLEREADSMGAAALSGGRRAAQRVVLAGTRKGGANDKGVLQRVKFEKEDIHGFQSLREIIDAELGKEHISPANTLFISVGRSPIVFATYLETLDAKVVYVPMSGLSAYGKVYVHLDEKFKEEGGFDRAVESRGGDILSHYIEPYLGRVEAMAVIDFGTSGGSNRAVFEIVKLYLKSRNVDIPVKMATLVRPGTEKTKDLDHPDNLMREVDPREQNEGVKRVLWVMHHMIDKPSGFLDKYSVAEHVMGSKPPTADAKKKEILEGALKKAQAEYVAYTKKKDFVPAVNTLDLHSSSPGWISSHRQTIMDKIGVKQIGVAFFVTICLILLWGYLPLLN